MYHCHKMYFWLYFQSVFRPFKSGPRTDEYLRDFGFSNIYIIINPSPTVVRNTTTVFQLTVKARRWFFLFSNRFLQSALTRMPPSPQKVVRERRGGVRNNNIMRARDRSEFFSLTICWSAGTSRGAGPGVTLSSEFLSRRTPGNWWNVILEKKNYFLKAHPWRPPDDAVTHATAAANRSNDMW